MTNHLQVGVKGRHIVVLDFDRPLAGTDKAWSRQNKSKNKDKNRTKTITLTVFDL
jgi:hypothetical protein